MPGPYPREFREDVVAVSRSRESGVTIKQIATDFGISIHTVNNHIRKIYEKMRVHSRGEAVARAIRPRNRDPLA